VVDQCGGARVVALVHARMVAAARPDDGCATLDSGLTLLIKELLARDSIRFEWIKTIKQLHSKRSKLLF
jgi:hypothetical protein